MDKRKALAAWLFSLCAMVFVMVVLGGLTRLTESGLSMVDWKPLTGWLPPLTEAEWRAVFAQYQTSPEYKQINEGMTLAGFKSIFWLEYVHRQWGRLIGVAFVVPLAIFLLAGLRDWRLVAKLLAVFVLGGLQAALGWHMVESGLIDVPEVDQYRLVAHLGLALMILGWLLWLALGVLFRENDPFSGRVLSWFAGFTVALVFLTVLSGGFVAGLDAGLSYNTFPTMEGEWIPAGVLAMEPVYINVFENLITAQFDHRVLAAAVAMTVLALWLSGRWSHVSRRARRALDGLLMMVVVQVTLGISTLLFFVPVPLAALHQAGAVILFGMATWVAFELRRGPLEKEK
jgi:heme a synthase